METRECPGFVGRQMGSGRAGDRVPEAVGAASRAAHCARRQNLLER